MANAYTPVAYEYREVINEQIQQKTSGKIFYWNDAEQVDDWSGIVVNLVDVAGEGMFIILNNEARIRIDRIITLFGKPGAAYDEYDAYSNACLSCQAGVPL
ncbi:hypothetical protein [Pseudochryseolinea flava]|uniref:Uncharacterized protein n=1 Tax=Pseudochryseolinea flava TaxID=2059302 RepID=A0A364XVD9_9BACT|nr:hypothetical protein [Pseudochryseolinea flava]RAV97926.1 hypothetical protein DQQ10_25990 [Pseudochryseolinea flava]